MKRKSLLNLNDQKEVIKIDSSEKNPLKSAYHFLFSSYPEWGRVINFLAVGALGFIWNLTVLTILLWAGIAVNISIGMGIATSTLINFFFDRHLVFSYARNGRLFWQFLGFVFVCVCGAMINYFISIELLTNYNWIIPQAAVIAGAVVAVVFNYICLRLFVFRA